MFILTDHFSWYLTTLFDYFYLNISLHFVSFRAPSWTCHIFIIIYCLYDLSFCAESSNVFVLTIYEWDTLSLLCDDPENMMTLPKTKRNVKPLYICMKCVMLLCFSPLFTLLEHKTTFKRVNVMSLPSHMCPAHSKHLSYVLMNGTVSLWCGGPDSFRCSGSVWPVQAPPRPAGVAAGCGDAEWRRDGAWPGNLLLASHSSYADRHTTWRTRIVGRRARIQRTDRGI